MTDKILLAASYDLKIHAYSLYDGSLAKDFDIGNSQANRIVVVGNRFYVAAYAYVYSYDATGNNNRCLSSINAHETNVADIFVTQSTIFSCGEDKLIKTWDKRTSQQQQVITTTESLNSIFVLPNGYSTVVGNEIGEVSVWDIRNLSSPFKVSNNKTPVRCLSLSPDGKSFVASHMDGESFVYKIDSDNSPNFTLGYKFHAHDDVQLRCTHSLDNSMFATTSGDNSTKIWLKEDGKLKCTLKADDNFEWVWDAAFTSDSKQICIGSSDGICRVWDIESGKIVLETQKLEKCVTAIAIIP